MSYCHECGEQVAKNDIFCPFCGISLKPVAGDDSLTETIVGMPPPAAATPAETPVPTPLHETPSAGGFFEADENAFEPAPEPPAPVADEKKSFGFSPGDTAENWAMKTESVEVPADVLRGGVPLEDLLDEPASSGRADASFQDIPTPALIQNTDYDLETPSARSAAENSTGSGSAPSSGPSSSWDDAADSTAAVDSSWGAASEAFGPAVEKRTEDAFESAAPAAPVDDGEEATPDSDYYPQYEQPVAQDEERFSFGEPSGPIAPAPESPIAMPAAPLEKEPAADEFSRFDSVQIIQKDEPPAFTREPLPAAFDEAPAPKPARPSTGENLKNADTDGRKAAKLKPLDEGTVLNGRYEIVRKIGGGGMGAVYLANDRNLGGVLRAVKEMVQSYIESEQQDKAVNDFKRESLLLTSLDHQAIPTIYDYFFDEKEGRFYLVMKYISGGDLAGRLRAAPEGRLDEKTVTEWAIQVADVLDYLHNHEPVIVYRDLKPANVMIDGNSGRVMLIDFGIARWVNKEEKGVTAVGTMGYAPPELFSGNVEPRSDIYSLGSTMFHLLTGADPQSNPLLIFDFQKNPRPRQINSQLSDQMERILMRAVEYNVEARFASAAEMREELREHLNNLKAGKVTFGVKAAPSSLAFSEQSVFCGFCGKQIVATDVFCAFCGAQQPIAQQSFSQSNFVQPVVPKLLLVGTNELDSTSFKLEKSDNLIGRRDPMSNIFPEIDLSKYDPQTKISRRHARIWREGNSFLVEDLGSSNGTTLLSAASDSLRLLPHQPHTLTNGDRLRVGDTTLHFTVS